MKTLTDFKLFQMNWMFNLNFSKAFEISAKQDYQSLIRDTRPESDAIEQNIEKPKCTCM